MKFLFIHPNIPGQYKHLVQHYAQNPEHTVVFLCKPKEDWQMDGVHKVEFEVPRGAYPNTHRYLLSAENGIIQGQEVWRMCKKLKEEEGFVPDIICCHPGWGAGLYLKDIYPSVPLLSYFEFYYKFEGADVNFDPELPISIDDAARVRTKNVVNLLNLEAADWGITPTQWQRSVHPEVFQSKISVLHEGINLDVVKPNAEAELVIDGQTLRKGDPIITYVTRNFEHYRGFHHFMRAVELIQKEHPTVQIIAVGADDVSYGRRATDGKTLRHTLLNELDIDRDRLHFIGQVPYDAFLRVLQVSSAHVYLTVPFVLSWSMLEAMAAECLVIGSNTSPVLEVLEHEKNGLVVDFFSPEQIAETTLQVVNNQADYDDMRKVARQTIANRFDIKTLLPLQRKLIEELATGKCPPSVHYEIESLHNKSLDKRLAS